MINRRIVFSLCFAFLSGAAFARDFSIGIKGGVRLTEDLESYSTVSESKRYTVGPTIEIKLSQRFGVEADALYKRLGTSRYSQWFDTHWFVRDRANSWEFPLLAKYSLLAGRTPKLFVSAGYSFRHISGLNYKNSSGAVMGAGVEINTGLLTFAPEYRYTQWFNVAREGFSQYIGFSEKSAESQSEILLGIRLHPFGRSK